jgi:hypothetical protein|tara:strand:+ start:98 stop:577 length:480 start_codon:yes stop_codon:yes gene_type:complete
MVEFPPKSVVYEEKKVTYWALLLLFSILSVGYFFVYPYIDILGYMVILPLVGLPFGIIVVSNIVFFSVKIFDDKTIKFGFPYWNKTLQSNEIISIEEIPYRPLREFGGLGWRIGRKRKKGKWRIGYVMWFQKGIEIESTNGKYYIFGTNNPESLISALQ